VFDGGSCFVHNSRGLSREGGDLLLLLLLLLVDEQNLHSCACLKHFKTNTVCELCEVVIAPHTSLSWCFVASQDTFILL
jgi:hypothetical protein